MSAPEQETEGRAEARAPAPRIAFERLRERTDELELLVSGLTVFALLSAPDWILSLWLRGHVHLGERLHQVMFLVTQVGIGLCYALAGLFLLHIIVRSYWIALIGLKVAFPDGIRWSRVRNLGPLSRAFYQRRLPDMDSAIAGADRFASMVFATANVVAISMVWMAVLLSLVLAAVGMLAAWLGLPERATVWMLMALLAVPASLGLVVWFIDTRLLHRRQDLAGKAWLQRLADVSLRVNAYLPIRLIMPLQLTMQGTPQSRRVSLLLLFMSFMVPLGGALVIGATQRFTLLGDYGWLAEKSLEGGLRSVHYEDMRTATDAGQPVPVIPSDRIAEAWLRLFLPHIPARESAVLAQACGDAPDAAARTTCAARLWEVQLDGREIDPGGFVPGERRDLGWRGYQVYLPMQGLAPGRHDLLVVWHPEGGDTGARRRREYRIPFWLSPGFELPLP